MSAEDEFDKYFAQAATIKHQAPLESSNYDQESRNRRGSLPYSTLKSKPTDYEPRRICSVKYPAKSRKKTAGNSTSPARSKTPSPRSKSPSPRSKSPCRSRSPSGSRSPLQGHQGTYQPAGSDIGASDAWPMEGAGGGRGYDNNSSLRAPSPRGGLDGFKCRSAPHSRSSSWKKAKRPKNIRIFGSNYGDGNSYEDQDDDDKQRRPSVPLAEAVMSKLEQLKMLEAEDFCVVRNFDLSPKGQVFNRGDSFKRSFTNLNATNTGAEQDNGSAGGSADGQAAQLSPSVASIVGQMRVSKVLVVGDLGVGKTALVQQFMTSEYMGAVETSIEDECARTVSVLLNGTETMMLLIDVPANRNYRDYEDVDAYVLVYSITSRSSFNTVVNMVRDIRRLNDYSAVITVANKSDLVRSRAVSENEAKIICCQYEAKFVEVSAALNHKVDELLVGIVSQIRLNPKRHQHRLKADKDAENCSSKNCGPRGLLGRIFKKPAALVTKSCDNLLDL